MDLFESNLFFDAKCFKALFDACAHQDVRIKNVHVGKQGVFVTAVVTIAIIVTIRMMMTVINFD